MSFLLKERTDFRMRKNKFQIIIIFPLTLINLDNEVEIKVFWRQNLIKTHNRAHKQTHTHKTRHKYTGKQTYPSILIFLLFFGRRHFQNRTFCQPRQQYGKKDENIYFSNQIIHNSPFVAQCVSSKIHCKSKLVFRGGLQGQSLSLMIKLPSLSPPQHKH